MSSGDVRQNSALARAVLKRFPWVSCTIFGSPVVPDVKKSDEISSTPFFGFFRDVPVSMFLERSRSSTVVPLNIFLNSGVVNTACAPAFLIISG